MLPPILPSAPLGETRSIALPLRGALVDSPVRDLRVANVNIFELGFSRKFARTQTPHQRSRPTNASWNLLHGEQETPLDYPTTKAAI